MENSWIIIYGNKETDKRAISILDGKRREYCALPARTLSADFVTEQDLSENNLIIVGKADENAVLRELIAEKYLEQCTCAQEYSIAVLSSKWNGEKKMIVASGYDFNGVLYGAIDLINLYFGGEVFTKINMRFENPDTYAVPFSPVMPDYKRRSRPSVKERGIWTWGTCIYDYKKFFDHMLQLKLNMVVIWNDFVPTNAKKIVKYAHECGIQVIWGYSWGWENKGAVVTDFADPKNVQEWKKCIYEKYLREYADTNADGIYFQSFTERNENTVNGKNVAELVTSWVNAISDEFYKNEKDIRIQFGLHATSVNRDLAHLEGVDKRMDIVWEDCGAFPFDYLPQRTENFEETAAFTRKVATLRGKDDKFGVVLKGMSVLNWALFRHATESNLLGEEEEEFFKRRMVYKEPQWRILQGIWLKNYKLAHRLVSDLVKIKRGELCVQMLVEDGLFEEKVWFPVALMAEILWDDGAVSDQLLQRVALFPDVYFANL